MATELSTLDFEQAELDGKSRRRLERIPALNMEEIELVSPTGVVASAWLGDESEGGLGVLFLGAAVGTVDWLQKGVQVEVRQGSTGRKAIVRHCTLDSPTVLFVGLEWVVPPKAKSTKRAAKRTAK